MTSVAINPTTTLTKETDVAVIAINSPPVNALSAPVRDGLAAGFKAALADPQVKAIVLICEGRTFSAGADISEFGQPERGTSLYAVHDLIEGAAKPVVAAIHGTALGGGLELALVCHYRVAAAAAKFGFPEINLGLVPGGGGTQRLPRLVGIRKALEMVTSGRPIGAQDAHAAGLVDEIAADEALRARAVEFARKVLAEQRPLRRARDASVKDDAASRSEIFAEFRRQAARASRGLLAPEYNIRCIEAATNLPFEEGLAFERKSFEELVRGTQSAALRYAFFAERQVDKIPDVPADTPTIPVRKVGVIGAGTMGGGIAMNFLNVGIPVHIVETKQAALERGLSIIRRNYESTVKKGRLSAPDMEQRVGLLSSSLALEDLADCDLIIEVVFEHMPVKKDVFGKLDKIAKRGTILATNTSGLDIDEIAAVTTRPQDVIGLHFFSPANVMRLVEVVRGAKTAKPVIATSMQLARKLGKIGVLVGVCPGFVGNRMLYPRQVEGYKIIAEGPMPWDVDRALYEFGFPMGPFAMSDLAGLDIGWSKEKSTSSNVLEVLCEMSRFGQKTGGGFYDYDEQRNARPSPVAEQVVRRFATQTPRAISDEEIVERCIYVMINEGAKILEAGLAIRPSDIDVIWIHGYGWPVYRGGPMFYADTVGLDKVVARLEYYAPRFGEVFEPAPLLKRLVAQGKGFKDL